MKDVIVIIAVTAVIVFGFFIMKMIDVFLEENRKAIVQGISFFISPCMNQTYHIDKKPNKSAYYNIKYTRKINGKY